MSPTTITFGTWNAGVTQGNPAAASMDARTADATFRLGDGEVPWLDVSFGWSSAAFTHQVWWENRNCKELPNCELARGEPTHQDSSLVSIWIWYKETVGSHWHCLWDNWNAFAKPTSQQQRTKLLASNVGESLFFLFGSLQLPSFARNRMIRWSGRLGRPSTTISSFWIAVEG